MATVVAVLGRGVVNSDEPFIYGDDLGVLRGDGVFETIHVRDGKPFLLDAHLNRMVQSAAKLELALPSIEELSALAGQACHAFDQTEGALRLVCTRGLESGGAPTVFATVNPVSSTILNARRDGLRLMALSLGWERNTRANAPWLLGGVKCLSYAATMAASRHAHKAGYDDVIWLSSDGFVFEGLTSSVVWLADGVLHTIPPETGILAGTTSRYLFDNAATFGLESKERDATLADLIAAEGIWLTSSVRGVSPVTAIGESNFPIHPLTSRFQTGLGFPAPAPAV